MRYVARSIRNLRDIFWTSKELRKLFKKNGREQKNQSKFVSKLAAHLNHEFQVFTSLEIAIIFMLQ